ncbi:MAG: pyrroline-5-carboxylate reductase [Planctomycetes bacterium]|nr:pyrroline-5-carboxylate reductase [Planctomycetota bacterium]
MPNEMIGFVGAGQMARALARGIVDAGLVPAERIAAYDTSQDAVGTFASIVPGCRLMAGNSQLAQHCQVIILAVKPLQIPVVLAELKPVLTARHLLISVAAGVTLARLAAESGIQRVIRVMPNTPCLVGQGASAYSLGAAATADDAVWVDSMLRAVGGTYRLDESLLDAVTGLSGSGPAFVYVMIEALSDGGVRVGLPRDVATQLAAQTVAGAAEMVLATGEHPGILKDRVASPGGTTIAGLQALEDHGIRSGLMAAVVAATRRSQELGQKQ